MPARQVVKKNGEKKKPVVCFALPKKCYTFAFLVPCFLILIRFEYFAILKFTAVDANDWLRLR